jgi:hypothetical protein
MPTQRTLTKIEIVGERTFHYFRNVATQEIVRVPCTNAEYNALGMEGAGQPSNGEGFVWINSAREPKYDTPDGDLTADSYAILGSGQHVVRLAEDPMFKVHVVDSSEIVEGKVEIASLEEKGEK